MDKFKTLGAFWIFCFLALGIFAFCVVANGVAFFASPFMSNSPAVIPVLQQQGNSTVSTEGSSTTLTASWQTYRNEQYGFEFKYPGEFKLREYDYSEPSFTHKIMLDTGHSSANNPEPGISITVSDFSKNFDQYVKDSYPKTKDILIYGINAKLIGSTLVLLERDQKIYSIDFTYSTSNVFLNSFLLTFKFVDKKVDTSIWKTYRNEDYGIELEYPSDWRLFNDLYEGKERDVATDGFFEGFLRPGPDYQDWGMPLWISIFDLKGKSIESFYGPGSSGLQLDKWNCSLITFVELPAHYCRSNLLLAGDVHQEMIYFSRGSKGYEIVGHFGGVLSLPLMGDSLLNNKMVSTFKFTK